MDDGAGNEGQEGVMDIFGKSDCKIENPELAMPAGPEIDALVAERVMGWTKMKGKGTGFWSVVKGRTQMIWKSELHEARIRLGIREDHLGDGFVWSPSLHLPDAMQSLEKRKDGGYSFLLEGYYNHPNHYLAELWAPLKQFTTVVSVNAETLSLAISQAVLIASRQEKERQEKERQEKTIS